MIIYGAGLAGLIAAQHFPDAKIFDRGLKKHSAVLRFRSPAVGDALGIEFKKVTVRKAIYYQGKMFNECNIKLANFYAKKVIGRYVDRSIWNLDTCDRWIAPDDLLYILTDRFKKNIEYIEVKAEEMLQCKDISISTLPLPALAPNDVKFISQPINIIRYKIPNAAAHQTIYFPDPELDVYRASVIDNILIVEMTLPPRRYSLNIPEVFGFEDAHLIEETTQKHGKILPIDEDWRRAFLYNLTVKHNIYSLGRFATWRNILLDDVLKDVMVIKKLMKTDGYGQRKFF